MKVSLSVYVNEGVDVDLKFIKAVFSFLSTPLVFDGRYDLALNDFLLLLHRMFENFS